MPFSEDQAEKLRQEVNVLAKRAGLPAVSAAELTYYRDTDDPFVSWGHIGAKEALEAIVRYREFPGQGSSRQPRRETVIRTEPPEHWGRFPSEVMARFREHQRRALYELGRLHQSGLPAEEQRRSDTRIDAAVGAGIKPTAGLRDFFEGAARGTVATEKLLGERPLEPGDFIPAGDLEAFLKRQARQEPQEGERDILWYPSATWAGKDLVGIRVGRWNRDLDEEPMLWEKHNPLYKIKRLAGELTMAVPQLDEANAVAFLLCDAPLAPPWISTGIRWSRATGEAVFTIQVGSPRVPPEAVRRAYASVRRWALRPEGEAIDERKIGPWTPRLVAFVDEKRRHRVTWKDIYAIWSDEHPEHPYKNMVSMRRSFYAAKRRN